MVLSNEMTAHVVAAFFPSIYREKVAVDRMKAKRKKKVMMGLSTNHHPPPPLPDGMRMVKIFQKEFFSLLFFFLHFVIHRWMTDRPATQSWEREQKATGPEGGIRMKRGNTNTIWCSSSSRARGEKEKERTRGKYGRIRLADSSRCWPRQQSGQPEAKSLSRSGQR